MAGVPEVWFYKVEAALWLRYEQTTPKQRSYFPHFFDWACRVHPEIEKKHESFQTKNQRTYFRTKCKKKLFERIVDRSRANEAGFSKIKLEEIEVISISDDEETVDPSPGFDELVRPSTVDRRTVPPVPDDDRKPVARIEPKCERGQKKPPPMPEVGCKAAARLPTTKRLPKKVRKRKATTVAQRVAHNSTIPSQAAEGQGRDETGAELAEFKLREEEFKLRREEILLQLRRDELQLQLRREELQFKREEFEANIILD